MKRLLVLLMAAVWLLSACTRPQPQPPQSSPPPNDVAVSEPPRVPAPITDSTGATVCGVVKSSDLAGPRIVVHSSWGSVDYDTFPSVTSAAGSCTVTIGGGALRAYAVLPPGSTEELARAALQVENGLPWGHSFSPDALQFYVEHARAGERQTIRLQGPLVPGGAPVDISLTLVREYPTVQVEVRQGEGAWEVLDNRKVYPAVPTDLRFRFSRPVKVGRLEAQLKEKQGAEWRWVDPTTLEVRLASPPAKFELHPGGLPDDSAMGSWAAPAVLYTGKGAELVAVDPQTGKEITVTGIPPEVNNAQLSPDGRWLAISAMRPSPETYWQGWVSESALLDLQSGKLIDLPGFTPTGWAASLLLGWTHDYKLAVLDPTTGQVRRLSSVMAVEASPDGRYAAGLSTRWQEEERESSLAPVDLVVVDLASGQERTFEKVARRWICHCDGGRHRGPSILWEGTTVLVKDERSWESWSWVGIDLATGQVKPADRSRAEALTPAEQALLASAKGKLSQEEEWGAVRLTRPDGTALELGAGKPVGWTPDGKAVLIRWPGSAYRTVIPGGV